MWKKKQKTIIPKFYKVKELTLVDICTKGLFVLVLTQEHYNMVVIGKAEDGREYV